MLAEACECTEHCIDLPRFVEMALRSRIDCGAQPEPDICRLPPCTGCGAVEFLVRTWDQHPEPGCQAGRHKGLVNRLFKDLVGAGKVDERCAATFQGREPGAAGSHRADFG